jgi:hypothetical protein
VQDPHTAQAPPEPEPDGLPPFETPDWLREEEEPERRRPSSRTIALVALAAIPWLVVVALVLRPAPGGADRDVPIEAVPDRATGVARQGAEAAPPPAPDDSVQVLGGARSATTLADAAAVAVPVARAWASGAGATLAIDGLEPTGEPVYVEHLAVEAVDLPAPDAAVVTLLAVVLEVRDGTYGPAHVRRLAVPVQVDGGGARPAGEPWWLPAPDLRPVRPATGAPIEDPDLLLEAAEALAAAGYADIDLTSLAASDGWALLATVRATAPGVATPDDHVVWLRRHLDELVVAGWRPTEAIDQTPPPDDPDAGDAGDHAPHEEGAP